MLNPPVSSRYAVLLCVVCIACGQPPSASPPESPTPATPATAAPDTNSEPKGDPADAATSPLAELVIEQADAGVGRTLLSAQVDNCRLSLSIEKARMDWRAEASSAEHKPTCVVLAPALKSAWVALSERARRDAPFPEKLGLGIDFRADEASVEAWFRHQAETPELQKATAGQGEAAYYKKLARHMKESDALTRFAELLGAMGLVIHDVSVEKVEVLSLEQWKAELPASAGWKVPAAKRLALPNGTFLQLRPK